MNGYNDTNYGCGCCGVLTTIAIIAGALLLAVGIILGAIFSGFFLGIIAAVAIFAIVMLILLIILLIVRYCRNCSC